MRSMLQAPAGLQQTPSISLCSCHVLPVSQLFGWPKHKSQPVGRAMAGVGCGYWHAVTCRVGKGAGWAFPHAISRAPCPRGHALPVAARRRRGHGARESLPSGNFAPAPLPTLRRRESSLSQKKIGPCLRLWARGSPALFSSVSLEIEGDGAPTRRCLDCSRLEWSGREASRPAPCGAPTRHLGLYAFDRGRTGPAPSGRRGCPSTARGRRLRKSFARRCRSRSPPTERLRKAPLETWIGISYK